VLTTTDGRELIDYCMSFGPLILGHAHPDVVQAITEAARPRNELCGHDGSRNRDGGTDPSAIPSMERVRLVSSGTEACMTAIRLARGATKRNKILKFEGCYHGHADALLVKAGSGVAGLPRPRPRVCRKRGSRIPWSRDTTIAKMSNAVKEHGDGSGRHSGGTRGGEHGLGQTRGRLSAIPARTGRCLRRPAGVSTA
jgi:glutamate-1-semialdehyde aminotransferase